VTFHKLRGRSIEVPDNRHWNLWIENCQGKGWDPVNWACQTYKRDIKRQLIVGQPCLKITAWMCVDLNCAPRLDHLSGKIACQKPKRR